MIKKDWAVSETKINWEKKALIQIKDLKSSISENFRDLVEEVWDG